MTLDEAFALLHDENVTAVTWQWYQEYNDEVVAVEEQFTFTNGTTGMVSD